MSWNDGISKEMSEFLEEQSKLGETSIAIFKKTIDEAVDTYVTGVERSTPFDTGGLKQSLTVEYDKKGSKYYGYKVYFAGNAPSGEPYEKIANILNYGTPRFAGTFFVSKAIRKLKGLSQKIEDNITDDLAKKT